MIRVGHRFMTGQICGTSGDYEFDGYTDASPSSLLTEDEKAIAVTAGKPFPSVPSSNKGAYWKFVAWVTPAGG